MQSELSQQFIDRLANAIAAKVNPGSPMKTKTKTNGNGNGRHKRTPSEMRCRYVNARGKRCDERSRGPRFHYLCAGHGERSKADQRKALQRYDAQAAA